MNTGGGGGGVEVRGGERDIDCSIPPSEIIRGVYANGGIHWIEIGRLLAQLQKEVIGRKRDRSSVRVLIVLLTVGKLQLGTSSVMTALTRRQKPYAMQETPT